MIKKIKSDYLRQISKAAIELSILQMLCRVYSSKKNLNRPLRVGVVGKIGEISRFGELLSRNEGFPVEMDYFSSEKSFYTKSIANLAGCNPDLILVVGDKNNPPKPFFNLLDPGLLDRAVDWSLYVSSVCGPLQALAELPSCLNHEKLFAVAAATFLSDADGIVAECGVFKGGTTLFIGLLQKELGLSREIHGFDTFSGLPAPSSEDFAAGGSVYPAGFFSETSKKSAEELLRKHKTKGITLHAGLVEENLPKVIREKKISFGLLDMDQYGGIYFALNAILTSNPKALLLIDDTSIPGVTKAIQDVGLKMAVSRRTVTHNLDLCILNQGDS